MLPPAPPLGPVLFFDSKVTNLLLSKSNPPNSFSYNKLMLDSFVFILRSATCGHCKRLMEERINPFIEETQSKIYSIEALKAFNLTKEGLQDKVAFSKYASCFDGYYDELFYYNDEKEITGLKGVPVTMIVENGKMVDYIYGYSSYYPIIEMITSYFIV